MIIVIVIVGNAFISNLKSIDINENFFKIIVLREETFVVGRSFCEFETTRNFWN